jgi:L-threonylcarbamoyladenylate synthase
MTEPLSFDQNGIDRAVALLRGGGLVAFATETVYGLGGDARDDLAVARIFDAKGRPRFNPLIVHVADVATAERYSVFDATARNLAATFWPGPLTMVLPLRPDSGLSHLVTAELPTVAIRIPAHPAALALLRTFDGPLAAPSANPSGRISPTRAEHVAAGLSGRIAGILDGGPCAVGVESTILGLAGGPQLLRAGGVSREDLETYLGQRLALAVAEKITAPGQMASHYAPHAALRLNVTKARSGEVLIGFGGVVGDMSLSTEGDLVEAAANLFHMLHAADAIADRIAVAPIPAYGLGVAINDRLARAAAPRG